MLYPKEFLPSNSLTPFIESYSFFQERKTLYIYPEGVFYLLYNLEESSVDSNFETVVEPRIKVIPVSSVIQIIEVKKNSVLVRCKAFVLALNKSRTLQETLFNNLILNDLSIVDQINQEPVALDNKTSGFLNENFIIDKNLRALVNYILERRGNIGINEMSENFGISRQAIHRKFITTINLGPKKLAKIWKLNNFIYLFQNGSGAAEAALDAGYYDQAHLINDFRLVYGQSPKKFVSKNPQFSVQSIQNRFNRIYDPRS